MNKLAIFAVALMIVLSSLVESVRAEAGDSLRARLAVRRNKLKAAELAPQVSQQSQDSIPMESSVVVAGADVVKDAADSSFVEISEKGMESSAEAAVSQDAASVDNAPHSVTSLDEYDAMLEARIKASIDAFTNAVNQINRIAELPRRPEVRPLAESMSKIQALQDSVEAAMKAKDDFNAKQTARVEANVARLMEIVREEEARLHKAEDEYKASIQPVIDDAQLALMRGESALDQSLKNTAASLGLSIASLGTSASTVSNALSTISNAMQEYMEKAIRAQIAMNNPELATLMGIPRIGDPSTRLPPPPNSNSEDVGGSYSSLAETSAQDKWNALNLFGNPINGGGNPINGGGNPLNGGGNALNGGRGGDDDGGDGFGMNLFSLLFGNGGGNFLNGGGNPINGGGNPINGGGNPLNGGGNILNGGGKNILNGGGNLLNGGGKNALNGGGNPLNSGGNFLNGNGGGNFLNGNGGGNFLNGNGGGNFLNGNGGNFLNGLGGGNFLNGLGGGNFLNGLGGGNPLNAGGHNFLN